MLFKYKTVLLDATVVEVGVNLVAILMIRFIIIPNSHDEDSLEKMEYNY